MVVLTPERAPSQRKRITAARSTSSVQLNWRLILALSLNIVAWAGLIALVMSFL